MSALRVPLPDRATTTDPPAMCELPHAHRSAVSIDPNSPEALRLRDGELRAVTVLGACEGIEYATELARGRRVLDVGCVDHLEEAHARPGFLHAAVAAVAAECLGVDIHAAGVERLQSIGYDVLNADITDRHDRARISSRGPFEVIIAGEVLEHLEDPGTLFELAATVLEVGGKLLITTPNPYAPHRVSAGRHMITWENVDHLFYAFPSGIAQLAAGHGLELEACSTTGSRSWRKVHLIVVRWLEFRLKGLTGRLPGRRRAPRSRDPHDLALHDIVALAFASRAERAWFGETAVYIVSRPR